MSANPIWGEGWEEVRKLWLLDPDVAHCNHGSFGAVPGPVLEIQDRERSQMVANPMRWFHRELPGRIEEARERIGRFLGAGPDDLALVPNVSNAVSTVLAGFEAEPGDEVVTSNHIYGAVSTAVDRFCRRTGASRVVVDVPVDADAEAVVETFSRGCSEHTGLIIADHISSATAKLFPVAELSALAHSHGVPILIDGAHAAGTLPVDVPTIGADFWTSNLHKWPCAPAGTGVLWVAPAWRERLRPLVVSGYEGLPFPRPFDTMGTTDLSAWVAAPASLQLLGELGWDRVRRHNETLVKWAQARLAEAVGTPAAELRHDPGLGMAIVPLPAGIADTREQAVALQSYLVERGVEAQLPNWQGRGTIRLSAHVYNQPADYERMAVAVGEFVATRD
jgi:isopenicillin-N epimerase